MTVLSLILCNSFLRLFLHFRSGNDLHFANKSSVEGSYTVPKTIHFVWTGKPILQKYIENIQTFAINKDYEVFRMNQVIFPHDLFKDNIMDG